MQVSCILFTYSFHPGSHSISKVSLNICFPTAILTEHHSLISNLHNFQFSPLRLIIQRLSIFFKTKEPCFYTYSQQSHTQLIIQLIILLTSDSTKKSKIHLNLTSFITKSTRAQNHDYITHP